MNTQYFLPKMAILFEIPCTMSTLQLLASKEVSAVVQAKKIKEGLL